MRVPPGSTVRILDAEAGRAQKGGEGSYFRSEGGGEGLFQGGETPTEQLPVSVPVRARGRLRRRLRCLSRCPPERGGGGRTGHRLPLLSSLPWGGGAKRAPKVPPIFATVGSGPDCTEGAFGPRKGGYPLSHVPYSGRRTGTSPCLRAPRARGGLDPVRGPGALSKRFPASSRSPVGFTGRLPRMPEVHSSVQTSPLSLRGCCAPSRPRMPHPACRESASRPTEAKSGDARVHDHRRRTQ